MKIAFFLIIAGLGVLWFANYSIQDIGLTYYVGENWVITDFKGWRVFAGSGVVLAAVVAAVSLLVAGLVAWLKYNFEEREKKLKEELVTEKQEAIAEIEKIHASQIENLLSSQTNNSRHLENAYAEVEKYKRMLANQENENVRIVSRIKGRDAVITRLRKKIDRLEMPRF